jgi:isoamylase
VHHLVHDGRLLESGLRNQLGYSTIGFIPSHNAYAALGDRCEQVQEFKVLVRSPHAASIKVIQDAVYNTPPRATKPDRRCRSVALTIRPTTGWRTMSPRYVDDTRTGNCMNVGQPAALRLLVDSLRDRVLDMHVDGFRCDLASALARQLRDVEWLSPFLDLVHQDPHVSQVKLITEP